jgi:hypothetical protein
VGLTTPHCKKQFRYEKLHKASDEEDEAAGTCGTNEGEEERV